MTVRILVGDCRERLAELPDASVQCVVTSPPYFGLRDYGVAGQIGLEPTLADYLATMVDVFREVRRVLRPDGTLWLNIGDSYHTDSPVRKSSAEAFSETWDLSQTASRGGLRKSAARSGTLKNKDLMMVPARLAIALCDDGWYLRSDIIWHKRAPMPESVTDRPTSAHEHIFLLTKQPRYFYDADAVREEAEYGRRIWSNVDENMASVTGARAHNATDHARGKATVSGADPSAGRNQRNVWTLSPEPFPAAHFATFVTEIPRRAIKAGTSEKGCCAACGAPWVRVVERDTPPHVEPSAIDRFGTGEAGVHRKVGGQYQKWLDANPKQTIDWKPTCVCGDTADVVPCVVLDPFGGSGTTGLVADELGRDCILVELNPEYAAMARERIYGAAPMFAAVEVA